MSTLMNTLRKFTSDMEEAHSVSKSQKTSRSDDEANIIKELDRGIIDKNFKTPKRRYLGASSLGDPCSRKIQYRYMGQEADAERDFSAQTLRIFALGHSIEDLMIVHFRDAGFDLRTQLKGEQFGFDTANGEVRGHIDGVIVGGPLPIQYPMLWECKSASDKKFKEFVRNGMAVSNPVYAAQVALYQAYMNLTENPCCFTVLNKNTSEIYIELVPFNAELAQATSDKAVNIIKATKANEMLPRVAQNSDYYGCRFCEFQDTCWSE